MDSFQKHSYCLKFYMTVHSRQNNCLFDHKNTVKPVNKYHPWERQHMVFIDKWSLFGGYFVYYFEEWLLKWDLYLQGCLYSDMPFHTGLTVIQSS